MPIDISVIIPLYNKEEFIEQVLLCIEKQTFTNWECIIVDDGSTDASQEIVKNFIAERGNKWVYVYQDNQGQAPARNNGMELAKGKYISFLDADDLWPTDKLAIQFVEMEAHPNASLVLSSYAIFNASSKFPGVVRHKSAEKMLKGCLSLHGFGTGLESVGLIRASLIGTTLRFDINLSTSAGLDFAIQLWGVGEIIFVRNIGLFYRISDGQWHTNSDELSRNLSLIQEKYEGSFGLNLLREHDHYLFWLDQRKQKLGIFALSALKSCLSPVSGRSILFFKLVGRFIVVRIRGLVLYRAITKQLNAINQ
jgi:glycosyltransferase involved in cell wall biosynthesis